MAVHFPSIAFHSRTITLGLSPRDRRAIESQIESLIAMLDDIDGDPNLEDDELHGDPLDLGEDQQLGGWLVYGADQTRGAL